MPITISNFKDRLSKDKVKNNLNSFPCSKNDQYPIQKKTPHKYGKAANKETYHIFHDNATLHNTPTEKLHKCMQ